MKKLWRGILRDMPELPARFIRGGFIFMPTLDPKYGPSLYVWGEEGQTSGDWLPLVPEIRITTVVS